MLEKFKEENKRKKQILTFTIICIFLIAGVFLYQSFALFETNEQFHVVTGNMENPGDISFAFYINDEIVLEAPKKDSGLALDEKSSCTNGVKVSWNVETWISKLDYSNYKQENTSKVKCTLYFRDAEFSDYVTSCGENGVAAECMKKYSDKDRANLVYDETSDNNLRYIGANPNNYVWFNEELWRIIGVMENIDDGTGKKENLLKLARTEVMINQSWSSNSYNYPAGINEWSVSLAKDTLMKYYSGLDTHSQNMVQTILWNTGATGRDIPYTQWLIKNLYAYERSENKGNLCTSGSSCSDKVQRYTTWQGPIGLMYPSDFGYATGNSNDLDRNSCLNTPFINWKNVRTCGANNWLYIPETPDYNVSQYTMTPFGALDSNAQICFIDIYGSMSIGSTAPYLFTMRPVLHVKSNIKISKGNGTKENPYILSEK